jgi:hypothetical protein
LGGIGLLPVFLRAGWLNEQYSFFLASDLAVAGNRRAFWAFAVKQFFDVARKEEDGGLLFLR